MADLNCLIFSLQHRFIWASAVTKYVLGYSVSVLQFPHFSNFRLSLSSRSWYMELFLHFFCRSKFHSRSASCIPPPYKRLHVHTLHLKFLSEGGQCLLGNIIYHRLTLKNSSCCGVYVVVFVPSWFLKVQSLNFYSSVCQTNWGPGMCNGCQSGLILQQLTWLKISRTTLPYSFMQTTSLTYNAITNV